MPAAGLRRLVAPIRGNPSPHGLLGPCVEVVTVSDPHELNGTEFLNLSCAEADTWIDCPVPPATNPAQKTFNRPGICEFDPVTAYAGVTCSAIGLSFDEAQQRALDQLRMGEQRALEEWFMVNGLCPMAAGNDLTPVAGAVSVPQGVAILENWLGSTYGGQGLIHAGVGVGALLSRFHIVNFGTEAGSQCPTTLAGTGIVLGSGYSANVGGAGCTQADAGEAWLYATGPVRVRRDERRLVLSDESQSVTRSVNDRHVLAESTFVVETACCVAAAVRISLSVC